MEWRRSSACSTDHVTEQCIEVARNGRQFVSIRNSKEPNHVVIASRDEWSTFMDGVRAGEFDDLV